MRESRMAPVVLSCLVALSACGSGGTDAGSGGAGGDAGGLAPAITSFTASPASVSAGTSTTLTWTVSGATSVVLDPGLGEVTGTSVTVTPTATTTYTLTARNAAGRVAATATVFVTGGAAEVTLVSIQVSPTGAVLAPGTRQALAATGLYGDGSTRDLTASVAWSSSDTAVATVSSDLASAGVVTGVAPGAATVSAAQGGLSASVPVTVAAATLVSIQVTPPAPSLAAGTQGALVATGVFSDSTTHDVTGQVTWSSSNPAVAAVSGAPGSAGTWTAVAAGSSVISATSGAVTGSTTVTVSAATLVALQVTPPQPSIARGTRQLFAATGVFSDASTQDLTATVTWASSSPAVATVSTAPGSQGLATAVDVGSTTVTATLGTVSGSAQLAVTAATLVTLEVSPPGPSIAKGTWQAFAATGVFSDGSTQDLTALATWASSDAAVGAVSNAAGSKGLVQGLAAGAATVSATVGAVAGSAALAVTAATLVSLQVSPSDPSIAKGTQQALAAIGTYSDGTTQDLTAVATWTSSVPAVATVSNAAGSQGLASAAGAGTTTVTATVGGASDTTTLTVTPATLVTLDVTPVDPSAPKGTTVSFVATGTFTDGSTQDLTDEVSWSSSRTAVATISSSTGSRGVATVVSAGTATITASLGGVSDNSVLTGTAAVLASVAVTPAAASLTVGGTQALAATGTYSDGSTEDVTALATWASSSSAIASVSNAAGTKGLVTGLRSGSAAVTATLAGKTGTASITVASTVLTSIAVTPASPSVARGYRIQFRATGTYSNGTTQDLTSRVTWASSSTTVATISNYSSSRGYASVLAAGTTTISASLGNVRGSTVLTGTSATLTGVAVTPTPLALAVGRTQQMTATGTFSDGRTLDLTRQVYWRTTNKRVASVGSTGLVKGVSRGTATVSATKGVATSSVPVTVQ